MLSGVIVTFFQNDFKHISGISVLKFFLTLSANIHYKRRYEYVRTKLILAYIINQSMTTQTGWHNISLIHIYLLLFQLFHCVFVLVQ